MTEQTTRFDADVFAWTGGIVENTTRIDSACFVDGNDDEYIIEFWAMSGSILRTQYNRRDSTTQERFVPCHSWEYDKLRRMADAIEQGAFYSI
jgi:hypothetical protein